MKKIWALIAFFLISFIIVPGAIASVSIGVSPGILNYKKVLRGGYAFKSLTVSTSMEESVLTRATLEGEVADWLSFDRNTSEFYISNSEPYELGMVVQPPETVENRNYTGIMHIRTEGLGTSMVAGMGSVIKADITIKIRVEVTGEQIVSCYIGGIQVNDAEQGFPIPVYATVVNDGNVRITPLFEFFVWDQFQEELLKTYETEDYEVIPTRSNRMYMEIPNQLGVGQYWMSIKVPECGYTNIKTFDILAEGQVADKGELIAINTKPWVSDGELVPIIGVFRNTGSRAEDVKIKFEIKRNGQLVRVLETETLKVLDGETKELRQYFLPPGPGRYEVRGVAFYNKKLSFEKGTVINVKPVQAPKPEYYLYAIYFMLVVAIVFILRKIIKAK